ncbi:MAG: hypothetical protein JOZ51_00410, partial [Chloroflexi bacterium]|nr:hypothetical protein [Chloroflexota bacterium]
MLRRLALLSIVWLLAGCGTTSPTVSEQSPAPAASPSAAPTPQLTATVTSTPPPTATIAASATPTVAQAWRSYTNDAGGYTLDIPADWGVVGEPASSVMFFAPEASLDDLATGEAQFFAGG